MSRAKGAPAYEDGDNPMTNVGDLLKAISHRIQSDWPDLDAQTVLAHVLNKPRTWILAHPETILSAPQMDSVESAVARLMKGEPLPYILGHWEFYGLDLDITPDVLIPRPETESLVEKAIAWVQQSPAQKTIADVGAGSGAIAVSLAVNARNAHIIATDISLRALEIAKRNADKFNVAAQIDFVQCDLLPPRPVSLANVSRFDLICANLPYIPTDALHRLAVFGREPTLALDGGDDGLRLFRRLLPLAADWLAPHGMILLEIEATLGAKALGVAYDSFSRARIRLYKDLAGRDRLLEIKL